MQMVRGLAVCSVLFFLAGDLFSQTENTGKVAGLVVDQATKRPLETVNVVLAKKSDDTPVLGTVTGMGGKFELKGVPAGEYTIRFSMIGYQGRRTASFVIDAEHPEFSAGTARLVETTLDLKEVEVTGRKELFNNAIDRKVYNIGQDMMSNAGSASQLLPNIPSVEVDMDGTVSLRGSSNVLILINGKNSPLMGKSRATVLEQIPASSIERIEVITNPSAKYNPEGTSGIINIVLKKNVSIGTNGNVTAQVGNHSRYNSNLGLNYHPGPYNFFGSYSIRKDNRNRINTDIRNLFDPASPATSYREDLLSYAGPLSQVVNLGLDDEIDAHNHVGISGDYFYTGFTRTDSSIKVYRDLNRAVINKNGRDRHDVEFEKEYGFTLSYEHNFAKEDQVLKVEFTGSNAPEQEDNHYTNVYELPASPTTFDNTLIKQTEGQYQLSLDYTNPLDENTKVEAGYAGEFNKLDQDFYAEYYDPVQQALVKDLEHTDRFILDESIHALYATYERALGSFGFNAGLRAEQAFITPNLVTLDSTLVNNYFSLYPTLALSYKLRPAAQLQLNYSRRTRRPEAGDLNPFPEYRDARNITVGNPRLLPEYIHSVELGFKVDEKGFTLLPSAYYRYTYNRFTSITQAIDDSTLFRTHVNLSKDQAAGFEMIVSANAGNTFNAHASANAFYNQIDASNLGYGQGKSIWAWSGALTGEANMTKSLMFQLNSNYSSARLTPQGETCPSYVVNLGLRQKLMAGKLSLVATVADLFKTLKRRTELDTPVLRQTVIRTRDSRVFYLGITYHFGAPPKKAKEESIKYDESL